MVVQKKNISLPMDVILDSIADGVFTIDTEKNITSFNKAAERITGITRKHAIGQKCFDVLHANMDGGDSQGSGLPALIGRENNVA